MRCRQTARPVVLWAALAIANAGFWTAAVAAQEEKPVFVEPAELARRDDLVGKLVRVDDRIRFFQFHQRSGYDELYLRRTSIPFRLPPELRPESPPHAPAIGVEGRLVREDSRLYVDVISFTTQGSDLDRLEKAVGSLPAREFENRKGWANWALKRAKDFQDEPLRRRAEAVQAEALRIEAEAKRVGVDAPREWLDLANEARRRKVAEPAPSALAHRAYQALLADANAPDDLKKLREEIERFFPDAANDQAASSTPGLAPWVERYAADPAAAYKNAPEPVRKALDRRLWVDVTAKLLENQVSQDLASSINLVDQAEKLAPERPELVSKLIEKARELALRDLGSLRIEQVRAIGGLLKDRAAGADSALEFYRDWLRAQRGRLGDADAEGRVALADRYEQLLGDQEAARELLDRAWRIAPGAAVVADAFKIRGYRRVGDDWIKEPPAADTPAPGPAALADQSLIGKTPDEVRAILATRPTTRSLVGTRGRLVEQWMFLDIRQRRYVNFLHRPGEPTPRAVSDYFLPR